MKTYDELLADNEALLATVIALKTAIQSNCRDDKSASGQYLMELSGKDSDKLLAEIKAQAINEAINFCIDTCNGCAPGMCRIGDLRNYSEKLEVAKVRQGGAE